MRWAFSRATAGARFMSIIEEAVRKNAERTTGSPPPDPLRPPDAAAPRAGGAGRYFARAALPAHHAGQGGAARQLRPAAAPGRRRVARVQDPAHARAAAPGSEPVALVRGHRRDGRRGQDAHRDQPGDRAGAGRRTPGSRWSTSTCSGRASPSTSGMRNVHGEKGLSDYLQGNATLREHRVLARTSSGWP